jgi:serine phosphatase RsbU (regulator of sigma subunit)
LGILIYLGFRRGGRVERMIAAALSLHFLVRITIFPMVSRFTGQTNFLVVGGWRVRLTALTLTVLGATTLIVFARVLMRDRAEKHRLATEFASARAVQQVLVPEKIPSVPGFTIAAVYEPFGEVGGDFFQILPLSGGVLVVIGDVSGKGMPAAMTVSLLVGTVSTLARYTQRPSEILTAMNERMIGRSNGGFTTCLVLRLDGDGAVIMANAGHIAPYVAGKEFEVESGLPLGLTGDAEYAESRMKLEPGQQLTLMTDGVVEARAKNGELFGFERTAALSIEPAEAIARAAQAFGQDDDITVLTIERAAAGNGTIVQSADGRA